ncbi:hypothetical protein GCM10010300_52340 [Streptomyces olivaceoviridis]|nr:hypothetical protein GCM10010300_52340 [Streptomyces olivaceoviridis]
MYGPDVHGSGSRTGVRSGVGYRPGSSLWTANTLIVTGRDVDDGRARLRHTHLGRTLDRGRQGGRHERGNVRRTGVVERGVMVKGTVSPGLIHRMRGRSFG